MSINEPDYYRCFLSSNIKGTGVRRPGEMAYKKDYKEIKNHVDYLKREYGFKGPLHFTDFSNLRSILDEGYLYSRNECLRRNLYFVDGANHGVLWRAGHYVQSCVRFYYRGKVPTLYDNEGIKLREYCDRLHIPIPVFLRFDKELLYLDTTEFTDGNATSSPRGNTAEFFKNMDWETIFHDTWFEPYDKDYIVNKRQAELLSREPVSLNYLKEIIFRSETDRKRALNIFGYDKRFKVDIELFSNKNFREAKYDWQKNNFIKDYVIEFKYNKKGEKTAVTLLIKYQKPWKYYETDIIIRDRKNNPIRDYTQQVFYGDHRGNLLYESQNYKETIVFLLQGDIKRWHKIEVEVNGVLSIEEFPNRKWDR